MITGSILTKSVLNWHNSRHNNHVDPEGVRLYTIQFIAPTPARHLQ